MTATLKLDYKVELTPITRTLHRLARADGDTESVFIEIGEHMMCATHECFENEVDPNGFAGPETLDATRAKKRHLKIFSESSSFTQRDFITSLSNTTCRARTLHLLWAFLLLHITLVVVGF